MIDNPTFNLKAVVQETGLKPDTLRVWERRYGLPSPSRTEGKHRLYSQRDINILKWLVERQQEGLSISRAVELWHQLGQEGVDPLETPLPPPSTPMKAQESLALLRQHWVEACLNFDELRAEHLLGQAFSLYPLPLACSELVQKGLTELGLGWLEGEVSVQQEHFASSLAIRWLEALIAASPTPTKPGRILLGCPAEEEHIISVLILNLLLRRQGRAVVYLGANIPTDYLEQTLIALKPNLVILAAQTLPTASTLLEAARILHRLKVPLGFGGLIFNEIPAIASHIPGHFLGHNLISSLQTIEDLMLTPPHILPVKLMTSPHLEAWKHFHERQMSLDLVMWQSLEQKETFKIHISALNYEMGRYIKAALKLGDLNFISPDLDWFKRNFHLSHNQLLSYWQLYTQIIHDLLDERGQVIKNWLKVTHQYLLQG